MVADIGAALPGYTLTVLDELPSRTVVALYQQAGRIRRQRLHDQMLAAGQSEAASILREAL